MSLAIEPHGADTVGPEMAATGTGAELSPLTADMPAERALGLVVAACRRDIARHRVEALASDDPSGIHDVRVGLRRLRAALGLFRAIASGREERAVDVEARELADALSPARDLQVFLFETAADAPQDVMQAGQQLVARRLTDARAVLDSARFAAFDRRLEQLAATHVAGHGECLGAFARRVLDRCEERVRRRGRGFAGLGTRELHRLRLAAKKLRYAVGFLAPLFESPAADSYGEAAIALQDALGKFNDQRMSRKVLGDIARAGRSSRGVRRSCRRLAKRVGRPGKRQRSQLKRAWKAFKRAEPFWHREPA